MEAIMKNIKYIKVLLVIITMFLNMEICYAAWGGSFSLPSIGGGDGNNNGGDEYAHVVEYDLSDGYSCSYKYNIVPATSFSYEAYNHKNESIVGGETSTSTESIKTGTGIGISFIETKSVTWDYNITITKKRSTKCYNYFCLKRQWVNLQWVTERKSGTTCENSGSYNSFRNDPDCTLSYSYTRNDTIIAGTNSEKEAECKQLAEKDLKEKTKNSASSPSYIFRLQDSNDGNLFNNNDAMISLNAKTSCSSIRSGYMCTHTYLPKAVCIDKVSANVRYLIDGECNSDSEFTISNEIVDGREHFHYFIPLDFTEDNFSLLVANRSQDDVYEKEACLKIVEALPTIYFDYLVVKQGSEYKRIEKNLSSGQLERIFANGCYARMSMDIPVKDGYFITNENNKIEGFNFYVKTINEEDPFPNPVNNQNSLWYDWYSQNYIDGEYSANRVSPNIIKSFEYLNYLKENVRASQIRNYNNDKSKYNDKSGYLDNSINNLGISKFIEDFDVIRYPHVSIYKLGCGPLNNDEKLMDGSDNPLFQPGCRR